MTKMRQFSFRAYSAITGLPRTLALLRLAMPCFVFRRSFSTIANQLPAFPFPPIHLHTKLPPLPLIIDGRIKTNPISFPCVSPATLHVVCNIVEATDSDVDDAVKCAVVAQQTWWQLSCRERSKILRRTAEILRSWVSDLAKLETLDTGKPVSETLLIDIPSAADCFDFFASVAATSYDRMLRTSGSSSKDKCFSTSFCHIERVPYGVVGAIGAWNYPFQIACWKAAPALACGNAVVFKPSEKTPLSATVLAYALQQAGAPESLFQVVQGGRSVGETLVRHPKVAKVSFTGSSRTGSLVASLASLNLKPVTMELGGKSPIIIFSNSSFDNALNGILNANFFSQGAVCSNGTRVFVQRPILNLMISKIKERVKTLATRVGNPFLTTTKMGAMIDKHHAESVSKAIHQAIHQGASVICGSPNFMTCEDKWMGDSRDYTKELSGIYLSPTVLLCDDTMTIVNEEHFGPVMTILPFDNEIEVVQRAKGDGQFGGLACGVFTRDVRQGLRVLDAVSAGVGWINTYGVTPVEVPFGGAGTSGWGRENGIDAVDCFTRTRTTYIETGTCDAWF